jgi:hypothetical protein
MNASDIQSRPLTGPRLPLGGAVLLALGVLLALATASGAEVFTVDRFDDNASATACNPVLSNDCSLRGAVRAANHNGQADTIVLPDGLYQLTLDGANEELAMTGDLDIRGPLTIQAAHGAHPVIEQTVGDRIFHSSILFFAGPFSLIGPMTLVGGAAVLPVGALVGGSIYVFGSGSLHLTNVTLTGGLALATGGCLYFVNPAVAGALTLTNVRIAGCTAGDSAGGMFALVGDTTVNLNGVTIENNHAALLSGGLTLSGGTGPGAVVVLNSILRDNIAGDQFDLNGRGGGAYFDEVSVSLLRSTVSANQAGGPAAATGRGGGLYVEDSTVLIQNSTLSGNRSLGIVSKNGSEIALSGSLVVFELSTVVGGATPAFDSVHSGPDSTVRFEASILQARCFAGFGGTLLSDGFNAEKPIDGAASTTCGLTHASDVFTTAALFQPLAGYGGPTPTHALLEGALGVLPAVPANTCNDPVGGPIDQRGAPRTQLFCEPGSYEHGAMAPGPWIFSDGFESGDTAAWSTEVP